MCFLITSWSPERQSRLACVPSHTFNLLVHLPCPFISSPHQCYFSRPGPNVIGSRNLPHATMSCFLCAPSFLYESLLYQFSFSLVFEFYFKLASFLIKIGPLLYLSSLNCITCYKFIIHISHSQHLVFVDFNWILEAKNVYIII